MRNLIIIVTALVLGMTFTAASALAQTIEAGIKGGINAASLSGVSDAVPLVNVSAGVRGSGIGGGFLAIHLRDGLWIQPEVLLSAKGATFAGVGTAGTERSYVARLQYVEVPVLLRIESKTRAIFATAGPVLAFNVGANYRSHDRGTVGVQDVDPMVRPRDVALALGAGTRISHVLVEGRWTQGLADVGEAGAFAKPVKTRTLSILAGVAF